MGKAVHIYSCMPKYLSIEFNLVLMVCMFMKTKRGSSLLPNPPVTQLRSPACLYLLCALRRCRLPPHPPSSSTSPPFRPPNCLHLSITCPCLVCLPPPQVRLDNPPASSIYASFAYRPSLTAPRSLTNNANCCYKVGATTGDGCPHGLHCRGRYCPSPAGPAPEAFLKASPLCRQRCRHGPAKTFVVAAADATTIFIGRGRCLHDCSTPRPQDARLPPRPPALPPRVQLAGPPRKALL